MCATSPNKNSAQLRPTGFTLLEVLIALALLGLLASALYGSYFAVMRSRDRLVLGMEARRELGATLDLVRREIAASLYKRNDKILRFVVEDRDTFGKPSSNLEFTTMAPPSGVQRKESGILAVRYSMFETEKEKRLILTRREQDAFVTPLQTYTYPQMETISAFLVECFDGSKWVKTWDTALNNALPKMVRITVQVEEDGKPVEFSVLSAPREGGS